MTHNLRTGLACASIALFSFSPAAFSGDAVYVSSLDGLRTAINSAPWSGRVITLAKGVYHQSATIRIQGKRNITIRGASSDFKATVIRGPGINDRSLGINFKLDNADHITFKNLTIRDSYYHAIQINNDSDYFKADHIRTIDNGESGFKITSPSNASGLSAYSDFGTIENSVIRFSSAGQRSQVEGIDIVGSRGWIIRHNHFNRIRKPNGGSAYAVFAKGNALDMTFEENVVQNSFIGLSFGGGGTGQRYFRNGYTRYEAQGGVIRNNIIHDVADAGIYMNKAHNFRIYGNTVIRNGKGTGAIGIRFAQSYGVVYDNRVSGPIKLRNGAHAALRDNTHISTHSPIPDQPPK